MIFLKNIINHIFGKKRLFTVFSVGLMSMTTRFPVLNIPFLFLIFANIKYSVTEMVAEL